MTAARLSLEAGMVASFAPFALDTENGKLIEGGRGDVSATLGSQVMLSLSSLGILEAEIDD
jgi:hypothetical protein